MDSFTRYVRSPIEGYYPPMNGVHRSIVCHRHLQHLPRAGGPIDCKGQRCTRIDRTTSADPRIRPTTTSGCVRSPEAPVVRGFMNSPRPIVPQRRKMLLHTCLKVKCSNFKSWANRFKSISRDAIERVIARSSDGRYTTARD